MAKKKTTKKATSKSNGAGAPKAKRNGEDNEVRAANVTRELPVKLTYEELEQKSQEHVEACNRIDAQKGAFLLAAGEHRTKMKELHASERLLRAALTEKAEKRPVECIETRNYRTNTLTLKRRDTGEVVDERALAADEQQLTLDMDEDVAFDPDTGEVTHGVAVGMAKKGAAANFDFTESDPHPAAPAE